MKFGEKLRETRLKYGLPLNKLGRVSGISPSYISKLENGKAKPPSEDVIFKLINGMYLEYKNKNNEKLDTVSILKDFYKSDDLEISEPELNKSILNFMKFVADLAEETLNTAIQISDFLYENKILLSKEDGKTEEIDYPVFDLEWLLKQEQFELFYGRSFFLNNEIDPKEADLYYNKINDEDKRVINNLIFGYISAKYHRINQPENFFNSKLDSYYEELYKVISPHLKNIKSINQIKNDE